MTTLLSSSENAEPSTRRIWSMAGAILALGIVSFCVGFRTELVSAIQVWNESTAYNHCFLILPISLYLIWERRQALLARAPEPSGWPLLLMVPAGLVWLFADRAALMEGRQLAAMTLFQLFVPAVLGFKAWRVIAFALLYLYFLVPFGAFLTPAMQDFAARFAVGGLHLLNIPVYSDGYNIEVPGAKFLVAEACAGLRFLIASIALGTLYGYMMYRSWVRRAAFIGVSVVIPVLANGLRVLGIVVLGYFLGDAQAAVADHLIYGWVFFSLVSLILIMLGLPFRQPMIAFPVEHSDLAKTPASPGRKNGVDLDRIRRFHCLIAQFVIAGRPGRRRSWIGYRQLQKRLIRLMSDCAPVIDIQPIANISALAADWVALQGRADCSFFQSWAWTGCLAEERFDDPWLLSARRDGNIVALALFNRGPRRGPLTGRPFLLGESGRPDLDTIFIEHNGILLDAAEPPELAESCWAVIAAFRQGLRSPRWIVSGVQDRVFPHLRAVTLARRPAPYIDLSHLPPEATLLDSLSANARQQLRRSLRAWEKIGPFQLDIAETVEQADVFLDGLQALHQRYWTGRGKPGAFSRPFFPRFHHALIRRPAEGQSVDLIRVSAGDRIVGYLYNLVHRGWVAAYQSGFDFGPDAEQLRPGLICHLQAIEHYRKAGMRLYDFLGGEARYKRSFAHAERELLWLKLRSKSFRPGFSPPSIL